MQPAVVLRSYSFMKSIVFILSLLITSPSWALTGIAMHGKPKYGADFTHFDTVNPDAPKGGEVTLGVVGTFDSLNPLILKGQPATGVTTLMTESLLKRSPDEPFSLYGLLAESFEIAPDRTWITFKINPSAKWQDGKPVTAKDVEFSHITLLKKGTAARQMYNKRVKEVKVIDDATVTFTFESKDGEIDRELPLIIGLMHIIPEHIYAKTDFEKTGLTPLMTSGPYKVEKVDPGRSVTYVRDPNYWGRDLAVNKGYYNVDKITYDYYRNDNAMFEALKAGKLDFHTEIDMAKWATHFNFKAIDEGRIIKEEVPHTHQVGMHAFAFNTRNPLFADPRVRLALTYAFDFDWLNKNLQHSSMVRTKSFFDNTELGSKGLPQGLELGLLTPFKNDLSPEVFTTEYTLPTFGPDKRKNIAHAQKLLKEAGWALKGNTLVDGKTGKPFTFEILLNLPANEKLALAFARDLKQLGITANVRTVDASQYENRRMEKNFDMIITLWGHTLSPGNEQLYYWTSHAADQPGTRNYPGIKSTVVDALCQAIVTATTREELVAAINALDRVLLWGHYVIPFGHRNKDYLVYSNRIDHPPFGPLGIPELTTWWTKPPSS